VALLLAIVVASAMLAAADLRTINVLGGHLSFSVLSFASAAASRAAMAAWKDFCAGIRTDEDLVADINAAFDVDGMLASWHLLLYKRVAADVVSVEGLIA